MDYTNILFNYNCNELIVLAFTIIYIFKNKFIIVFLIVYN